MLLYNQRGNAEQHIKEGKYTFRWTGLSCRRFRGDQVRLRQHALAYNRATSLRCIDLPDAVANWSLTNQQLKLIKIRARVARNARAITFQLAKAPTGRGRGHRPNGALHPFFNPPSSSTPSCASRQPRPELHENGSTSLTGALKNAVAAAG